MKIMRKNPILIALAFALATASVAKADVLDDVKKRGTLIVGQGRL